MFPRFCTTLFLVMGLMAAGCISGTVTDGVDPVPGINVTFDYLDDLGEPIQSYSVTTKADGGYTFFPVPNWGEYAAYVDRPGCPRVDGGTVTIAFPQKVSAQVNFILPPCP
jgi:hypothetical protein